MTRYEDNFAVRNFDGIALNVWKMPQAITFVRNIATFLHNTQWLSCAVCHGNPSLLRCASQLSHITNVVRINYSSKGQKFCQSCSIGIELSLKFFHTFIEWRCIEVDFGNVPRKLGDLMLHLFLKYWRGNQFAFFIVWSGPQQLDEGPFFVRCPDFLWKLGAILFDYRICRVNNSLRRTIVLFEFYYS